MQKFNYNGYKFVSPPSCVQNFVYFLWSRVYYDCGMWNGASLKMMMLLIMLLLLMMLDNDDIMM